MSYARVAISTAAACSGGTCCQNGQRHGGTNASRNPWRMPGGPVDALRLISYLTDGTGIFTRAAGCAGELIVQGAIESPQSGCRLTGRTRQCFDVPGDGDELLIELDCIATDLQQATRKLIVQRKAHSYAVSLNIHRDLDLRA